MARLTKEAILQGTRIRESLRVKDYGDAEVVIRPLTDGELSKIFSVIGNVPLREDGSPDLSRVDVHRNLEALRMATSMGMEDPKLTPEEVAGMKFGVPEFIGMKVLELSGVTEPEARKKKAKSTNS